MSTYSTKERVEQQRNYALNNWEKHTNTLLVRRIKIRLEALRKYGGEFPKCSCCGEDRYEFLVLDHVNDDGHEQRLVSKGGSTAMYAWLKRNNWPPGLEVCCHNCNMAREFYGVCPHKIKDYEHVTSVESAVARRNPKRERSRTLPS
jgi:hypothetical protein